MKRRFRHLNGKATKWIERIPSKKYAEKFFRQTSLQIVAMTVMAKVQAIECVSTESKIDEVLKQIELAQAMIDEMKAINIAACALLNLELKQPQ